MSICPLYLSVCLSICTVLSHYYSYRVKATIILRLHTAPSPQRNSPRPPCNSHLRPQSLETTDLFSITVILLLQKCYVNGIIQHTALSGFLRSASCPCHPPRGRWVSAVLPFCCRVVFHRVDAPLCTRSPAEGHPDYFQAGTLMHKVLQTLTHRLLTCLCTFNG